MNELQAKLARRRTLNGEGLNGASSKDESSSVDCAAASIEPETVPRKEVKYKPAIPAPARSTSTEELQNKLARRRNLNGEAVPAQPAPPEPSRVDQGAIEQISAANSAVKNETIENPEAIIPVQHDTVDTEPELVHTPSITANSNQYEELSGFTTVESQTAIVDALAEEHTEVSNSTEAMEAAITETETETVENNQIIEDHIPEIATEFPAQIDERDYDSNPELTPLNPELQIPVAENAQENTQQEEDRFEESVEALPELPPPILSLPPTPAVPVEVELFQSVEDTMNMIDQEILQLRPVFPALSSQLQSQQEPEVTYYHDTESSLRPPPLPQPPSIPAPRADSNEERNLSFNMNNISKCQSQSRQLSSSSPLSGKSRKSQENLLSPSLQREPISSPSSASSAGKGWYPGKYLLQRISTSTSTAANAATTSATQQQRKASAIITMDQEQAQAYYNALINNDIITPPTPSSSSAKSRVFTISKDDNNQEKSMTILIEENVHLKTEIMRLQDELDRRQAIIDSYQLSHLLTGSNSDNDSFNHNQKAIKVEEKSVENNSEISQNREKNNDTRRRRVGLGYYTQPTDEDDNDVDDNLDLFGSDYSKPRNNNINFYSLQKEVDFTATDESHVHENGDEKRESGLNDEKALFGYTTSSSLAAQGVHPSSNGLSTANTAMSNSQKTTINSALFGPETNEDTTTALPANKKQAQSVEATMEYEVFLQRFVKAGDLQDITRKFIFSVLGPQGDTTEPHKKAKLDYVFYGTHRLDERCRQFFDDMQERFHVNKYFQDLDEELLLCARDCLEQHVMNRLGPYAFKLCETTEDDVALERRMKVLSSFMTPEMLDIKPDYFNETLLAVAATELKEINIYRTPREKANCVVKCVTIIFRSLSVARVKQEAEVMQQRKEEAQTRKENGITDDDHSTSDGNGNSDKSNNRPEMTLAGADDFLPLFIWVVLQSRVPRLYSNCEYVQAYLNPARLKGQPGYCLINLHSAVSFLTYLDPTSLNVDPAYFEQKMLEAEEALGGGSSSS